MEDVYKTLGMFVDLDPCKTGTVPASIIQQGNDFFPSAAEANVKVRATRLKGSNLLSNSANDADYSGVIKGFNRSSDSAPSGGSTVAKDPSDWFSSGGNL